jgi:hypothetical protein
MADLASSLLFASNRYLVPLTSSTKAVVDGLASQDFVWWRFEQVASSRVPLHVVANPRPDNVPNSAQVVSSFRISVILS